MRLCCFDCFGGIAGDMTLAAFADAGVDLNQVEEAVNTMPIPRVRLTTVETRKHSLAAKLLRIEGEDDRDHRHLTDILEAIEASRLPSRAKERACAIYTALGEAECRVHGDTMDHVHFHEVGALDSVVDIVGVAVATDLLGVDAFYATPLPFARGAVKTDHGLMPLPAPATLALMQGMPTRPQDFDGETVTPTGAAILKGLQAQFVALPPMRVSRVGTGAGNKDFPRANILRVILGEADDARLTPTDTVQVIEANLDDMNPQLYQPLMDRLYEAGALEAFLTPVHMKKGRIGTLVTVLAKPGDGERVAQALLANSTTIGCRMRTEARYCLEREMTAIDTPYGVLRVKRVFGPGIVRQSVEFDDALAAAQRHGVPVAQVMASVPLTP